jgi:hypothetical protein
MRETTIVLSGVLLILSSCGEKKEHSNNRLEPASPRIVQLVPQDSTHHSSKDSSHLRMKPSPPLPLDEMTRTQLNEYKQLLTQKGFYSCCVEPSCRMCLFEFEECLCEHNLKKREPVCGECYDKWHNGRGKIKGIKPEEVLKMK